MVRLLIGKMANPIRRCRPENSNVLPFCYELALGSQRSLASNSAIDTAASNSERKSEHIEENPYYAKYADKIKKVQAKTTKPTTFSDLKNVKSELVIDKLEDSVPRPTSTESKSKDERPTVQDTMSGETKPSSFKKKPKRSLDDIVKVDLLKEKSAEEITEIWNLYHSKKNGVYATIPASVYDKFYKNTSNYPVFILPLPRNRDQVSDDYEFFLLQFQEHSCFFTSLAAFHLYKEMAPICLTLHYYPELLQSKGLVLLNSEYDSNILNVIECQCLVNQLQYYYTTEEAAPKLSLHLFNKEPKSFDHMRLIRGIEDGMLSSGFSAINLNKQD